MRQALLILAAMALCSTAFAAAPSKTSADMARVVAARPLNGAETGEAFCISIVEEPQAVADDLQRLFGLVNDEQQPPAAFFPDQTRAELRALLPEGCDMDAWELNEFVAVQIDEYESGYGGVEAQFVFATQYQPGQRVVAALGAYRGEAVEWIAVAAEVQQDGSVAMLISQQAMLALQSADAVALAVLSEPAQ